MTTTPTIPADAGLVLVADTGEQLFVLPGHTRPDGSNFTFDRCHTITQGLVRPVVVLAEGEWDHEGDALDDYAALYVMSPMKARRLGNALLNAANDIEKEA